MSISEFDFGYVPFWMTNVHPDREMSSWRRVVVAALTGLKVMGEALHENYVST